MADLIVNGSLIVAGLLFLSGPYFLLVGFWRAVTARSIRNRGEQPKSPWRVLLAGTVLTILDVRALNYLSSITLMNRLF